MNTRALAPRILPMLLILTVTLVAAAAEPAGAVRYVAPAGSDSGGNPCLDPANPCATLAHALGRAMPGDTVRLAAGVYRESGLLVDKAIAIVGDGAATTVLDGTGRATLLAIAGSGELTVEDMTLLGGAGERGGALRVETGGRLVARRIVVRASTAQWGGAIYLTGGTVVCEVCRFDQNSAEGGGAIFAAAGTLTISRSHFNSNRAEAGGGLLIGPAAAAALRSTILEDNQARHGAGAYVQGTLHAVNSLWRRNHAAGRGGGLFNDDGDTVLEHTAWLDNTAALGGSLAGVGAMRLRNSLMAGNSGGACATTLAGSDNLLQDATCGLPPQPVTDLKSDGRPGSASNAIDAVPAERCVSATGEMPVEDLRGEPRPADGDGDSVAHCDIGPYELQPHLVITIAPTLADATQFNFNGALGTFVLSAGQRHRVFEIDPGSYRLTLARKANWKTTAIVCAGDTDGGTVVELKTRAVTLDLDTSETMRCTYSERPTRNSIGVTVITDDGPVSVPVAGDLGEFDLHAPQAADRRSGKLVPGLYSVQAPAPAGWRIEAIDCAGDQDAGTTVNLASGTVLVDLDKSETIGCVFRLARVLPGARLTIRHEATPADDADFTYTGDLGPFLLRAPSASAASYELRPGNYRVHELLHPLWMLSDIACSGDADGGTVVLSGDSTVHVDLDLGEQITCVFRHVRADDNAGSITLIQSATPDEAVSFAYDGSLGAFALALPDPSARTWTALTPGSYTLHQSPPDGWQLDAITCSGDSDDGSMLAANARLAVLDLDAGEAIVCTFANSRPTGGGSIAIVHDALPADDTEFRYQGSLGGFTLRAPSLPARTFAQLQAGQYNVNVLAPDGWRVNEIVCGGDIDAGSVADTTTGVVAIDLDSGEAIACRFAVRHEILPPPPPEPKRVYIPYLGR